MELKITTTEPIFTVKPANPMFEGISILNGTEKEMEEAKMYGELVTGKELGGRARTRLTCYKYKGKLYIYDQEFVWEEGNREIKNA